MSADEIIAKAASLAGVPSPANAAILWELAEQEILNYTNRMELPRQLELIGVQILADIFTHGSSAQAQAVQSISEGDTSVTYGNIEGGIAAWERYKSQLIQFRRFARKRGKHGCSEDGN